MRNRYAKQIPVMPLIKTDDKDIRACNLKFKAIVSFALWTTEKALIIKFSPTTLAIISNSGSL